MGAPRAARAAAACTGDVQPKHLARSSGGASRRHCGGCGGATGSHDPLEAADPVVRDDEPEHRLDRREFEDLPTPRRPQFPSRTLGAWTHWRGRYAVAEASA